MELELKREQPAPQQLTQMGREHLQRAERSLVAALLQHPLPVAAGLLQLQAEGPGEGPPPAEAPSQGGGLPPAIPSGIASHPA